ncbi:hypothetical protein T492DRAFT_912772 [Pavlovales sp. CCMP2436]|nr:hypothetical protein T492DRAFT_912772 [Pavlovales sp. CCMP2436]
MASGNARYGRMLLLLLLTTCAPAASGSTALDVLVPEAHMGLLHDARVLLLAAGS